MNPRISIVLPDLKFPAQQHPISRLNEYVIRSNDRRSDFAPITTLNGLAGPSGGCKLSADDGVWITPFGKFVGKEQIKKFLDWQSSQMSYTVEIAGNDIIASDKKAFFEHFIKANVQGKPVELSAMCAWEFNDDDKVTECRTVYDRFSTLEQAATGIGKIMVGLIAKQFVVR